MKKKPILLITYCVLALGIGVVSFAKPDVDYSSLENRTMNYLPGPTVDNVVSGEWFSSFESYNADQIIGREELIQANSRLLKGLGNIVINDIAIGKGGILIEHPEWYTDSDSEYNRLKAEEHLELLKSYKTAVDSYGGQLYDIEYYARNYHFWDAYRGYKTIDKEDWIKATDEKIAGEEQAGVIVVDANDISQRHSDEYLYFYTDHHYTFKGAYYTYRELLNEINMHNPGRQQLVYPEWDDMNIVRPGRHFWGSIVTEIGDRQYEGKDYLEYCLPDDFPTKYDRYEFGQLSDMPLIREDPDNEEYGWFMNGDYGNTVIRTYREELPNILFIGYSFTDPLELMAIYNFNEMHSIDPRDFSGSIEDYIRDNKCDYVVVVM